jgi:hypothetical protein
MLRRTHADTSQWLIVKADNKRLARLNIIKDILSRVECPDRDGHLCLPDRDIVFQFEDSLLLNSSIAP